MWTTLLSLPTLDCSFAAAIANTKKAEPYRKCHRSPSVVSHISVTDSALRPRCGCSPRPQPTSKPSCCALMTASCLIDRVACHWICVRNLPFVPSLISQSHQPKNVTYSGEWHGFGVERSGGGNVCDGSSLWLRLDDMVHASSEMLPFRTEAHLSLPLSPDEYIKERPLTSRKTWRCLFSAIWQSWPSGVREAHWFSQRGSGSEASPRSSPSAFQRSAEWRGSVGWPSIAIRRAQVSRGGIKCDQATPNTIRPLKLQRYWHTAIHPVPGKPVSKRYLLPVFIGGSATATWRESGANL